MAVISELEILGENKRDWDGETIDIIELPFPVGELSAGLYNFAENVESGLVCENAVKEPIINMQISGNSVQDGTPTPEAPIEVQSVGEKTSNLLEYPYYENTTKTKNGITWQLNEDRSITASGTSSGLSIFYLSFNQLNLEDGKTYYFKTKGSRTGISLIFAYYDESGTRRYDGNGKVWSNNYTNPQFYLQVNQNVTASGTFFPYIVAEDDSLDYEHYGYKVPVKISSKNLIDYKKAYSSYGAVSFINNGFEYVGKWMIHMPVSLEIGKYYTFSSNIIGYLEGSSYPYWIIHYTDNTYSTATRIGHYALCEKEADRISLYVSNSTEVTSVIENIQLEEGKVVTEYVPYVDLVTTNIYLNEPLRKIGDYADYIDYKNKKVVRTVKETVCNGTEDWKILNAGTVWAYYYLILGAYNYIVAHEGLNTHFIQNIISSSNSELGYDPTLSGTYNDSRILIRTKKDMSEYTDISEWITFLTEQYNNGTPMKMYYVLLAPVEETIDIPEIFTSKGTNIFSTETTIQPSETKVNYWKQI